MDLQQQIIQEFGVKPQISVDEEIRKRVDFLKDYVKQSGSAGLLIAISGGLDSAVAAGLCKLATDELTEETGQEYRTLAVFQPYGEQDDIADSYATARALGLSYTVETNIEDSVDEIALEVEYALKKIGVHRHLSIPGKGNVKARVRMVVQYALAFEQNLLVVGTDHASEKMAGFFTKWGDGAVDIMPLSSLNKRQVKQLAVKLGVPRKVIDKVPTAGLWSGQTDEQEMGVSYEDNCDYLEGKDIDPKAKETIEKLYQQSAHKRAPIPGI